MSFFRNAMGVETSPSTLLKAILRMPLFLLESFIFHFVSWIVDCDSIPSNHYILILLLDPFALAAQGLMHDRNTVDSTNRQQSIGHYLIIGIDS